MYAINGDARFFQRILHRAKVEHNGGDFTLPILLCAVAIESEITRLFWKWSALDEDKIPSEITAEDEERWQEQLRKAWTVKQKLNLISEQTVQKPFQDYVQNGKHSDYLASALSPYKYDSLSKFQQMIFERRNKIVHSGELDFTEKDSVACLGATDVLLQILVEMDAAKFRTFQKSLFMTDLK